MFDCRIHILANSIGLLHILYEQRIIMLVNITIISICTLTSSCIPAAPLYSLKETTCNSIPTSLVHLVPYIYNNN